MALPPLLSLITVSLLWRHLLGRERRGGTLLLPPAVLRDRFFRAGIVITLLYQLTTASLLLATALVLQSGLGFSPFHTALLHIPFALGAMFSIAVAGRRLSPRLGRNVTLVGVAVQMSGLLLMGYGIATAPGTLALTALGLGFGLCRDYFAPASSLAPPSAWRPSADSIWRKAPPRRMPGAGPLSPC